MNDFKEATRVKEFEITCSEIVDLIKTPEVGKPSHYTRFTMVCNFNIQTIFDRSLSEIHAEETLVEKYKTDRSTGPIEG